MSRASKTLFVVGGAMMLLSGPAFLLGVFMLYREMGNFSLEENIADYFNWLLLKWVAPSLIMLLVGVNLVAVAFIVRFFRRQRRPNH